MAEHQFEYMTNTPLPEPLTSLVGREREIAKVCALIRRADVRLLTITGTGGVGKTRLAMAAASAVKQDFFDGARFVSLAAVQDPGLVADVLTRSLGVHELGALPFVDRMRTGAEHIEALLVLDNFEHLMPAGPLVTELLEACPRLKVLATSRERLHLSGEWDFPVSPLPVPDPERFPTLPELIGAPAVILFAERALSIDASFVLTDANAATVAAVCHRLDGLPLAIELAAARSPHLTPAALLGRLARRLPMLTGGPRDTPARLRTMRDAIAWSYDLLTSDEQALFRRLSVFAGGFSLVAVEALAATRQSKLAESDQPLVSLNDGVLDGISSLVDKNLVRRSHWISGGPGDWDGDSLPRFEMLETVREFGHERLVEAGEDDAVLSAHAAFYAMLVEQAEGRGQYGTDGGDPLEAELANLRAALIWAVRAAPDMALCLSSNLGRFWLRSGKHREGSEWLLRALSVAPDAEPSLRAEALNAAGDLLRELGERAKAESAFTLAREVARASGKRAGEAIAMTGLGSLANDVGNYCVQKELCDASVAIFRDLGDRRGLARAVHNRGWASAGFGDLEEAAALFQEALEHARAAGDNRWTARALCSLGDMQMLQGDFEAARTSGQESLAVARAGHDRHEMAVVTASLGMITLELGDTGAARRYLTECLGLLRETGRRRIAVFALEGSAVLAEIDGHHERALRLVAAAGAARKEMGMPIERDAGLAIAMSKGHVSALRALQRLIAGAAATGERALSLDEAMREATAIAEQTVVPDSGFALETTTRELRARTGLTRREVEILRLLATGLTDREIAERLFISRRTASNHVASIRSKLGVASRRAAASEASFLGLIEATTPAQGSSSALRPTK